MDKRLVELQRMLETASQERSAAAAGVDYKKATAEDIAMLDRHDTGMEVIERQIKMREQEIKLELAKAEAKKSEEEIERGGEKTVDDKALQRKLFVAYVRGLGLESFNATEMKVYKEALKRGQVVGDNAKGGYLAPEYVSSMIIEALKDSSGAIELIDMLYTSNGNVIQFGSNDDTNNMAVPIAEATAAGNTSVDFGRVSLAAHKFTSNLFKISNELLTDSIIDVEQFIINKIRERFERAMNFYFTGGTGSASNQPLGFTKAAFSSGTLVSAGGISYNELVDLEGMIDPKYAKMGNLKFTFSQGTETILKKLVDDNGLPIWTNGSIQSGTPKTILGHPYVINNDMPSLATAGAKAIGFGDFKRGYRGRVVNGLSLLRSNDLLMTTDEVALVGFMRFDGNAMDTKAVKFLAAPAGGGGGA